MPTISILSAMIIWTKAWHLLSSKTFTNCFKIAVNWQTEMERVHDDEDGPFLGLNDIKEAIAQTLGANLAVLNKKICDQADLNVTPDEIFDFDIELATTRGSL